MATRQSHSVVDAMSGTSTMSATSTNAEPETPRSQTDKAGSVGMMRDEVIIIDFLDKEGVFDMPMEVGDKQA